MSKSFSSSVLPKAFLCYSKDKNVVKKSSSGGVFYSLASAVINKLKGVVYGCVIDWDVVYHSRAETIDQLLPMLGSKYVRSDLKNTFIECSNDLINGKFVLFSGTPCQIGALLHYLNIRNVPTIKLLTIDVICHGTPELKYWKLYLSTNFKNRVDYISFREKKDGWENFNIKIGDYESSKNVDPYMVAFLNNQILSKSCFSCHFKGDNHKADVTIGDFWGINNVAYKFKNNNGNSLILIRNKINDVFELIKSNCFIQEVPYISSLFLSNSAYYESVKNEKTGPISLKIDSNQTDHKNDFAKTFLHKIGPWFYNKGISKNSLYYCKKKRKKNGRIGILTDIGYSNFGNRLQNYALITIMRNLKKKPKNIIVNQHNYNLLHYVYNFLKRKKEVRYFAYKGILRASLKYEGKPFIFSKNKRHQRKLCNFETILIGSDQVWNTNYHIFKSDLEYLLGNFNIINQPFKISSYAASLCFNGFNESSAFLFKNSLKTFDKITVREEAGKALLNEIGIESDVVLDPTFLLSTKQWIESIKKYSKMKPPSGEYNFLYTIDKDSICEQNCFSFNNILTLKDKETIHSSNQFDFLNYILNANLIITDSFHAVVFSILFKKKIFLLRRKSSGMESRLSELFKLINIQLQYNQIIDFNNLNTDLLSDRIDCSKKILFDILNS